MIRIIEFELAKVYCIGMSGLQALHNLVTLSIPLTRESGIFGRLSKIYLSLNTLLCELNILKKIGIKIIYTSESERLH